MQFRSVFTFAASWTLSRANEELNSVRKELLPLEKPCKWRRGKPQMRGRRRKRRWRWLKAPIISFAPGTYYPALTSVCKATQTRSVRSKDNDLGIPDAPPMPPSSATSIDSQGIGQFSPAVLQNIDNPASMELDTDPATARPPINASQNLANLIQQSKSLKSHPHRI